MGNCQNDSVDNIAFVPSEGRLGSVCELKIVNLVWEKDYQGLFDYEANDIAKKQFTTKENCLMIRQNHEKYIELAQEINIETKNLKNALFQVMKKTNYFKILPIYIEDEQYTIQKLLWLVVKSVPNHKYVLRQRDILKFGKQKIKVREIIHKDEKHQDTSLQKNIKLTKKVYENLKNKQQNAQIETHQKEDLVNDIVSIVTENEQSCRICLEPGQYTNPLICPCKCTGSIKYIHFQCLRTWLGKRLDVSKNKNCVSIKWIPLSCEMCKNKYNYRIYMDNKKFYTVDIPKPTAPYIVLEVIKTNIEFERIFHFVSLGEISKVSIGRKKQIDVKISDDISVSRHHANILYDLQNKQFLLEDHKSKFGTLVLIKRNLVINPLQRGLSFQIGAQIFSFESIRESSQKPIYNFKEQQVYLNFDQASQAGQEDSEQVNEGQDEFEEEIVEGQAQIQNPSNIPTNQIIRRDSY